MNTYLCDAPDSGPADLIGPLILMWLQDEEPGDWVGYMYGERVIRPPGQRAELSVWCLSEWLEAWLRKDITFTTDPLTHDTCPWQ